MFFTTFTFLAFLLVSVLLYYLLPRRVGWIVLLVSSLFYFCLTGFANIVLILITWCSTYLASRLMGRSIDRQKAYLAEHGDLEKAEKKAYRTGMKKNRLRILVAALVLNFGLVALLKLNLFSLGSWVTSINAKWHISNDWELLSMLGLSFYTFQTMGYLIEVYREKAAPEHNPFRLGLFISFFPLLIQGPICRYSDIYAQLFERKEFDMDNLYQGALRIAWGLFKKFLIANRVDSVVTSLAQGGTTYKGPWFLFITILYSVSIYADFTGGIDMTIGIGQMYGIAIPENFRQPYFSKSTKEYWNRWHITLGKWFTDYVFYPASTCKPVMNLSTWVRKHVGKQAGRRIPLYIATLLTWFVTGLWHGTTWNFISWGLVNGVIILVSQELIPAYKKFRGKFPKMTASKGYAAFEMFRTFIMLGITRILVVYPKVRTTLSGFVSMFRPSAYRDLPAFGATLSAFGLSGQDILVVCLSCLLIFVVSCFGYTKPVTERLKEKPVLMWVLCLLLIAATILFGRYGYGYDLNAFRYA